MNYDYLIVGAGFYGAVIAERIATQLNKKVLIVEKRDHIGGNSYSFKDDETNIEIHKYGSHLFHTSNEKVWNYLGQFTEFNDYQHKVYTTYKDKTYSMPVNLDTINSYYEKNFTPDEAKEFIEAEIEKWQIENPSNLEEKAISLIGKPLYEAFIKGYTQKQWQTELTKLPANIITRLPVRFNYNNRYFKDKYEGLPVDGYGAVFEKMLDHPNIEVKLGTDFFEMKDEIPEGITTIYSGPIDRYFDFRHGVLGWRTIDLEREDVDTDDYQGTSVMNYAEGEVPFTRIHEYKHYHPEREQSKDKTIIFREFSRKAEKTDDPYYPINTLEDKEMYAKYLEETKNEKNVIFGGRLGTYSYLDMHQVIAMALNTFENKIQ